MISSEEKSLKTLLVVFATVMDGLYLKITQDFSPDPKEARFGGKDAPMAVEKGDIIFDVRKRGDGWMYGKNLNSGKTGKFPERCAAKLSGTKSGSGSESLDSGKKDEKPAEKKDTNKPAWLQNRTTSSTPTSKKTPVYPKPYSGNIRESSEKNGERKETSGDSGVVVDSTDGNCCNEDDDSKPVNRDASKTGNTLKDDKQKEPRIVPRSLASSVQTGKKQKPETTKASEPAKDEKESVKTTGRPFRLNSNKSSDNSKPTTTESKAVPKVTKSFEPSAPAPQKALQEDLDENYEPVEKKSEERGPLLRKAVPKSSQAKDNPITADVKADKTNLIDNPKRASEKNQSDVTAVSAAGGAGVNIQENPLSKDEGSIYQVPSVVGPPKPARNFASGCAECNEPHIYDTPMHYKTPPSSPSADKRDGREMKIEKTKEGKPKGGSTSLKPTSSVIKKTKEQIKHRMASYEDIEMEGRRSEESLKDAECTIRETKEKLLTPKRRPKMRILLGMLLGLMLGVLIFLTLYLLTRLHVVVCVVSALIIAVVVATIFGFLDKTRLQCIVLLIFPSLFASGGKISLWLIIMFFIISGPVCNFIENVRIVAVSRGCQMSLGYSADSLTDNSSVNLPRIVMVNENNRAAVRQVQKYENISHALQSYINYSLLLSSFDGNDNLTGDDSSSGVICMRYLHRAHNICSSEIKNIYSECTQTLGGIRRDLKTKCDFISPKNACDHLTEAQIANTCQHMNTANTNTLIRVKKILEQLPERLQTQEIQPDEDPSVLASGGLCEFIAIVAMLLPLLLLLVLYEAYRYHKLYLSSNEFDNHYLTTRFKAIEDMRKSSGAADLLVPLKKAELQKFVQPTVCQLAEPEKANMLQYLLVYLIYLLFALIMILLDYFFHVVITKEEPQSNISKRCNGHLKRPQELYTIILSTLLGVLLLIILLQPFVLRLRRLIASRFYPRRERKRIAYLYYKLLEERKTFYKSVIENMNNFSEETEMLNRLDAVLVLCNNFSWIKKVLEFVGVNIRRCAVCGAGLNKKYLFCDTEDCDVIYCRTCFWDLENKCLGCMRNSKMTSRSSSLSGQSQRKKNDYVKPV